MEKEYPEIEKLFEAYEKDNDDQMLSKLGYKIRDFLVDLEFMAKYWFALLNYLGYDPMPIELYNQLFNIEYPEYNDVINFFQLPISEQNKISRKIQRKAKKLYLTHRIKNFFK